MFWRLFVGDSLVLGTEDGIQMLQGRISTFCQLFFLLELPSFFLPGTKGVRRNLPITVLLVRFNRQYSQASDNN